MSQNDYTWEYNGESYELDLDDLETSERFENAIDILTKREKEMTKDGKLSTTIRGYCAMYYEFFDNIFGEGSANKIFEGKTNARLCEEVYFNSFIPFAKKQGDKMRSRRQNLARMPQNREQRRHGNKNRNRH